jgi:hypothetical protein
MIAITAALLAAAAIGYLLLEKPPYHGIAKLTGARMDFDPVDFHDIAPPHLYE